MGEYIPSSLIPSLDWPSSLAPEEDYLVLVWTLLVHRSSISSSSSDSDNDSFFSWRSNDVWTSSSISELIFSDNDSLSDVLLRIRSLRSHDPSSSIRLANGPKSSYTFFVDAQVADGQLHLQPIETALDASQPVSSVLPAVVVDVLDLLSADPAATVQQASQLGTRELDQLWAWNSPCPPTIERGIHEIISDQIDHDPDRSAVVSWDGELSYRQLDDLSTRLAHHLISRGVSIGQPVPLCFEKSRWTIVGVMAVIKAGGGLVLMDPSQPEGRLQTITSEVQATLMLTSEQQADLGQRLVQDIVVVGPQLDSSLPAPSADATFPSIPSDSPLYIQFTSGSTGKPKGVVITHANYTSGAIPRAHAVGYTRQSRVLDFPSYAFDVSVDCMLCTLAAGGCICVPSEDSRVNDLSGAVRSMSVNMAHMTPSVARVLDPDILPALDVLGLGGESIAAHDAAVWGQSTHVIIAYGPSECTVGCTINNNIPPGRTYTSIGRGVGGATWIVDPNDHQKLVPIGAVGELLVEGPIVGTGYLNEPEKTAAVFIEDPVWLRSRRSGRLYKTGDLVRYDPDGSGSLVFIGRADAQVKLRGQRVELGEVEHHVQRHLPAGARVAAEVLHPGGRKDDATLVVFIAEQAEPGVPPAMAPSFSEEYQEALANIETNLSADLPRYMIPAAFLPLNALPLLVSLKTDRKQLRALGNRLTRAQLTQFKITQKQACVPPQTDVERQLHCLWQQTLNPADEFGRNHHFFRLGGDSLKAMKLVAAAREAGLALRVSDVFQRPTLAELATTITPLAAADSTEVLPFSLRPADWVVDDARTEVAALCGLKPAAIADVYPCTPLQEALMALSAKVRDAYVAQRVVELPSVDVATRLRGAFEAVAKDSAILRTRIVQVPRRGLMQVITRDLPPWTDYTGTLDDYLTKDQKESMGLGAALARFATITTSSGSVYLVLTIHHALYDGWSMPLIVDRVNKAFRGENIGHPTPFSHFIRWLGDQAPTAATSFWSQQLAGAVAPQFPGIPRKGYQTRADSLREHYVSLSAGAASSTSIATAIRGAWALVASRYTSTNDVVFGETLTGRTAPVPGVEEIEGPMITTVPVRVFIDRTATAAEYLQQIHGQMVDRMPHEHLGLQHIRRLSPDAREACELRTGIVIHPTVDEDALPVVDMDTTPATAFVPTSEAEAAREALKFNSYALMLVFTVDPRGFLIMASFDSNTVDGAVMDRVLPEFAAVIQALLANPSGRLEELNVWQPVDVAEPRALAQTAVKSLPSEEPYTGATAVWIVNPADVNELVPVGAVGELLVARDTGGTALRPTWLESGSVHRTGQWGKCMANGTVVFVTPVESQPVPVRRRKVQANAELMPREKALQELFSRILDLPADEISVDDDFFELGGDSIRAMKLVSEARLEGLQLTVAAIFDHRQLRDMTTQLVELQQTPCTAPAQYKPFSTLNVPDVNAFVEQHIKPNVASDAAIIDIYPTRPLQAIAVEGTIRRPRYSVRYELFHFDTAVDKNHLLASCQELVSRNEILRTVFVQHENAYYSVVLSKLTCPVVEYSTDGDLDAFTAQLCQLDAETTITLGGAFVKFLFVQHHTEPRASLALRISHAQYDEICLPILLHQLAALYERREVVPTGHPFGPYVGHIHHNLLAPAESYWRNLLAGSSITKIQPGKPADPTEHLALLQTLNISARPKSITVASLPTAIWALLLSRRTGKKDIVFGEVVSGRNLEGSAAVNADTVIGPTWQYVPFRVRFQPGWTGHDLLRFAQKQHVESAPYEALGLSEIVARCTDWPAAEADWFDSVVHQDVEHVEDLSFKQINSRMQTVYPQMEPLREIKFQAFPKGDDLGLEIVTVKSWAVLGTELLQEAVKIVKELLEDRVL